MSGSGEADPRGFLLRWSRLKRKVEASRGSDSPDATEIVGDELGPAAALAPSEPTEGATPATAGDETAEPPFDLSTLPAIEEITAASDITGFLQKGVPEALKNAALRRMWSADPAIRDHIGPVDYGWDFNNPESIPGFGALPADFDSDEVIRRLQGEVESFVEASPPKPNVESAALEPPSPVDDALGEAPIGRDDGSASAASNEAPVAEKPPIRRRHGGALPRI